MQFNEPTPRHNYRSQSEHTEQRPTTEPQPAEAPAHHSPKPKKVGFMFGRRRWFIAAIVIILVLGIGWLTYGYIHTRNQLEKLSNPSQSGQTAVQQITNHIDKVVQLPAGETPTLATVSDVSKLQSQVFFKNAKNGDEVLIYTKSNRAILYRPSTQKVIEYSLVNLGNASQ